MQLYAAAHGADFIAGLADSLKTHPDLKRDRFTQRQLRRLESQFHALQRMSLSSSSKRIVIEFERAWLEMLICKAVDAFEFYLTGVLRRSLKKNPTAIPDASIKVEDLLT